MIKNVFLHLISLGDEENSFIKWLFVKEESGDPKEGSISGSGSLKDFIQAYTKILPDGKSSKQRAPQLIGILPGSDVSYLHLGLPTKNKSQMWQALPFMAEEYVVDDIETVSLGAKIQQPNRVRVSVVQQHLLEKWKELFENNDFVLDYLVGQPDLLNPGHHEMEILIDETLCFIKSNDCCFEVDCENFSDVFSMIPLTNIDHIKVFCDLGNKEKVSLANRIKIEKEASGEVQVTIDGLSGNVWATYLSSIIELPAGIENLLLSSVDSEGNVLLQSKMWLPSIAIVFLLVIFQVVLNISSGYYFDHLTKKFIGRGEVHYASLFPDEPISDLNVQWNHKLDRSNVSSRQGTFPLLFVTLMSSFKKSVAKVDELTLLQFRYDKEGGELKLDIQVPSIAVLDEVKKSMKDDGLDFEVLSANQEGERVKSSIKVSLL